MGSSASTAKEQLVVNSEENIKKVTVVAGVAIVGLLLLKLLDNNNNCVNRKVMKAPGRSHSYIYRDDFERDPSDYFRRLHLNKSKLEVSTPRVPRLLQLGSALPIHLRPGGLKPMSIFVGAVLMIFEPAVTTLSDDVPG
ncbi:hypothetical protein HAX54_034088 [Datura stramonium]|uniref:Uncharacterized protein n=1 Tax=Datura stramonium TaxID=4076 RepID=A0ABS8VG48_DATST|nr:hypothetical protein [Datura stramonium]